MLTGFATVTLWVNDFEKSIHFYRDILELEMTSSPGDIPQFKVGNSFLVLAKGSFCPPVDSFPPDFPQLGLRTNEIEEIALRLQKSGVELDGNIEDRRDSRWLKVCDPDGNQIELIQVKGQ